MLQSRPQSLGELVASWVRVVPFSCRSCGYRFLEWVGMRGMAGFLPDRRRHLRVPVRLSLSFSGGKVRGKGTVIDISLGGCKIQSDVPVTVDDIYYLEILVSEQEPPIEVPAIVRSVGPRGIVFTFLRRAQENKRLQTFIRSRADVASAIISDATSPSDSGCVAKEKGWNKG
ncbi:MAG: PilZ domain-containing protein [Nitrospira sp.]|nr:PilZ domain-containing protein [Nitrospira sp.]MCP9463924.1 PilZ domain-containing protein [Nitrospira sp.]